jgi:uracil-DNA glycosylase
MIMSGAASLKSAAEHATILPAAGYQTPRLPWNRVMIVGEAPGAEEIKQDMPFVGRSGQLLDKALAQAGVARAASYVANVFYWQPPGNKVDHFFASRRAAAAAGEGLVVDWGMLSGKYCQQRFAAGPEKLRAAILKEKPRVLLAVGRTPLWALTGLNGIIEQAGKIHPCRFAPEIPVLVTYHPSYILRGNWGLMDAWVGHMKQVVESA